MSPCARERHVVATISEPTEDVGLGRCQQMFERAVPRHMGVHAGWYIEIRLWAHTLCCEYAFVSFTPRSASASIVGV